MHVNDSAGMEEKEKLGLGTVLLRFIHRWWGGGRGDYLSTVLSPSLSPWCLFLVDRWMTEWDWMRWPWCWWYLPQKGDKLADHFARCLISSSLLYFLLQPTVENMFYTFASSFLLLNLCLPSFSPSLSSALHFDFSSFFLFKSAYYYGARFYFVSLTSTFLPSLKLGSALGTVCFSVAVCLSGRHISQAIMSSAQFFSAAAASAAHHKLIWLLFCLLACLLALPCCIASESGWFGILPYIAAFTHSFSPQSVSIWGWSSLITPTTTTTATTTRTVLNVINFFSAL